MVAELLGVGCIIHCNLYPLILYYIYIIIISTIIILKAYSLTLFYVLADICQFSLDFNPVFFIITLIGLGGCKILYAERHYSFLVKCK